MTTRRLPLGEGERRPGRPHRPRDGRTAGVASAGRWLSLVVRSAVSLSVLLLPACSRDDQPAAGKKLIVLGFDGLDARLAQQMLDEGRLPNFAKLAQRGGFKPLRTSTPPQSPVAWSSIITGTNPGEHGIFDFIHREAETYRLYSSTTKTTEGSWQVPFGKWRMPIFSGRVVNLRHGEPFWVYLTKAGVPAHIYRIPANYPPEPSQGPGEYLTLTDMGTPDLRGSLGEFSFYDSGALRATRDVPGGHIYRLNLRGDVASGEFYGPPDGLINSDKDPKAAAQPLAVPFSIYRDPRAPTAIIEWGTTRVLLAEGEWSDWESVGFSMGPGLGGVQVGSLTGRVRLHLKKVRPEVQLYVSPIQVDPIDPALPISMPPDFAAEVAERVGPYYTQGLPEDTKALTQKVFDRGEFLEQARLILDERLRLLDFALDRYKGGFLFFYFGSTDQIAHMFWGAMVEGHPALTAEDHAKYKDVVRNLYVEMDAVLAKVVARYQDADIICLSDHGFGSFSRGFNVNTWLIQNGYQTLREGAGGRDINSIDWKRTRAYAIGINGLYVNLRGRERDGIVDPADQDKLLNEIGAKLLEVADPRNGAKVIQEVYRAVPSAWT